MMLPYTGKSGCSDLTVSIHGGGVALEAVADAGDLVVAALEKAARIGWIIKSGGFQFFEGVGLPRAHFGHGIFKMFVQDGAEAGLDDDFTGRLAEGLEGAHPGVHVGDGDDPVEVVVVIGGGVGGEVEFAAPAFGEAAPKEIADGHAVGFGMAEGAVEAVELAQRIGLAPGRVGGFAEGVEHAHGFAMWTNEPKGRRVGVK
jgi:hypothetical protein